VVAARPTAPSLLSLTAETFLALGLPHKAHAMLGNAPARIRRSASMRLVAGRVALANKHLKEAATLFNAILKDDPRSPDALMELGRLESARGHQTKARAYFARALKLRPRDPELYEALSQVHARSGRPAKAITYGMRAADLFRERNRPLRACEALIALGRSLRAGDKRSVIKAEEILFEATKIPGAPARAYLELGLVHKKKDDLNRAAWCFRQAGRRDPQLAEAHLQLGLALSRKRKRHWRREAVQALRRFLKLRPKGEKADLAKARLKAL
jgi:tetratricopeptide (TPR) repeat protein